MSKSVYSLVLSDEIVRAIDSLAYRMNTSRSALIDRILAEKLSMQTPEIRMRNIMENISSFFDEEIFRLQTAAGDGGMLIKSPLPYKYKPTIRYSVELMREGKYLGRLKVSFRTQNAALVTLMNDFLTCFASIERRNLAQFTDIDIIMQIGNDKMTRMLNKPILKDTRKVSDPNLTAKAIADYVNFLDRTIKLYFENADNRKQAIALIDAAYKEHMKAVKVIV